MSDVAYHELFPLGPDDAPYRKLTGDHVLCFSAARPFSYVLNMPVDT